MLRPNEKIVLQSNDQWVYVASPAMPNFADDWGNWEQRHTISSRNAETAIETLYPDLTSHIHVTRINQKVLEAYELGWLAHIDKEDSRYSSVLRWGNEYTFHEKDKNGQWMCINRVNPYYGCGDKQITHANRFEAAIWVDDTLCAIGIGGLPNESSYPFVSVMNMLAAPFANPLRGRATEIILKAALAHADVRGVNEVVCFGSFSPGAEKSLARIGLISETRRLPHLLYGNITEQQVYVATHPKPSSFEAPYPTNGLITGTLSL
jgi:hypothetical protein